MNRARLDDHRFDHQGIVPINFQWDGDAMIPRPQHRARCDRQYVIGSIYRLAPSAERSNETHNHFFACIAEAFKNLPEDQAGRFPTPEHLRKWALIKSGHCTERAVVTGSKKKALEIVSMIQPLDEYAIVLHAGRTVTVFTAKSISRSAVKDKAEFQAIKQAALEAVAELIGVEVDTLTANAGKAA